MKGTSTHVSSSGSHRRAQETGGPAHAVMQSLVNVAVHVYESLPGSTYVAAAAVLAVPDWSPPAYRQPIVAAVTFPVQVIFMLAASLQLQCIIAS